MKRKSTIEAIQAHRHWKHLIWQRAHAHKRGKLRDGRLALRLDTQPHIQIQKAGQSPGRHHLPRHRVPPEVRQAECQGLAHLRRRRTQTLYSVVDKGVILLRFACRSAVQWFFSYVDSFLLYYGNRTR